MQTIRVLVIDDSAFMRKVMSDALSAEPNIEVIGEAENGEKGLYLLKRLHPDVVTLDYEMPGWNGLQTLEEIIAIDPVAVVMVSSFTKEGTDLTLECLSKGAVDFVCKPSGAHAYDIESIAEQLRRKVTIASTVHRGHIAFEKELHTIKPHKVQDIPKGKVIVIGASTGGPRTVEHIVRQLPNALPCAILVVIHMPPEFTGSFAERLARVCAVDVKEAQDGEEVRAGVVYVAPGDWHLRVAEIPNPKSPAYAKATAGRQIPKKSQIPNPKTPFIRLSREEKVSGFRPSIDVAMQSVASVYGERAVGVILSGMGEDGVRGMKDITEHGGKTIVQNESTCMVYGMPKRTIEAMHVDLVLPEEEIAEGMLEL
jgi:two-component system, chemotaxis family, protein-glutamate methylesterase/glutaminase